MTWLLILVLTPLSVLPMGGANAEDEVRVCDLVSRGAADSATDIVVDHFLNHFGSGLGTPACFSDSEREKLRDTMTDACARGWSNNRAFEMISFAVAMRGGYCHGFKEGVKVGHRLALKQVEEEMLNLQERENAPSP